MQKQKFYLALFLLAAIVFSVDANILKFPFFSWQEPRWVIAHICVVLILCVVLIKKVGVLSAFTGALLFGLYPGHAFSWAMGMPDLGGIAGYVIVLGIAVAGSFWFEKFHAFLKTQEYLVRVLFYIGVAALVSGMALMSIWISGVWQDEASLWRWRVEHHPTPVSLNAWARLLYHQPGKAKEAVDLYEKTLKVDPRNQEAYLALGMIYQDLDNPEKVIGSYNQLLKLYPEDELVYVRVMDGYRNAIQKHPQESIYQEKREDVLTGYEQLGKRKKYTANDYLNLGFLYEQVGGYEEAMRFFRKALELAPKHEKALYSLANCYQASGDVKTALVLYERLVRLYPRSSQGYLNMGIIYNALGEVDKARYLYQKAIGIDPNNADVYFNLGYLNENAGELREALNDYEKAVEHNPRHAEAYYNMGNVYAVLEQYPEAIASYLKAVGINPDHQNAFVNLSILSFKAKNFEGAVRYLEEARLLGYSPPAEYLKTLEPYRKDK